MAWRPSEDLANNVRKTNKFWQTISQAYANAFPASPLPRCKDNPVFLSRDYICERQGDKTNLKDFDIKTIPRQIRKFKMGLAETEVLQWLLFNKSERILKIVGRRGVGKSTYIHYIEYLLAQERKVQVPNLIIINANIVGENRDVDETTFIKLIIKELTENTELLNKGAQAKEDIQLIYKNLQSLSKFKSPTFENIQQILKNILVTCCDNDSTRLVVVFDNLDPLTFPSIENALSVARQLLFIMRIGSILCLRPSTATKLRTLNSARALVGRSIRLRPPAYETWMKSMGRRIKFAFDEMRRSREKRVRSVEIMGVKVTNKKVEEAGNRFYRLLRNRPADEDPLSFMQSVASSDMRHFSGLVRRILEHRRLPVEWLLGSETEEDRRKAKEFHPLRALMEGVWRFYRRNPFVPNLLWHETRKGVDFLICHRAVRAIGGKAAKPINNVAEILSEYGYDAIDSYNVMETLREANMIYCVDRDRAFSFSDPPTEVGLTESGVEFDVSLMCSADYLSAVVMDVPLRHEELRRNRERWHFTHIFSSLLEYFEEVREAENRELSRLRKRAVCATLALAADRLMRGNLLTARICEGIVVLVNRGLSSKDPIVLDYADGVRRRLPGFIEALRTMEQGLQEVWNRGQRANAVVPEIPEMHQRDVARGAEAQLRFVACGADTMARIGVESREELAGVVTQVNWDGGSTFSQAVALTHGDGPEENRYEGELHIRGNSAERCGAPRVHHIFVPRGRSETGGRKRNCVIVCEVAGDKVQLSLIVPDEMAPMTRLGGAVEVETLRGWSETAKERVFELIKGNALTETTLRGLGCELQRLVLSDSGNKTCESFGVEIQNCLMLVPDCVQFIPWEWLTVSDGDGVSFLRDRWCVMRLEVAEDGPFVRGIPERSRGGGMRTIGLEPVEGRSWIWGVPTTGVRALELLNCRRRVHIVGRRNGARIEFLERMTKKCDVTSAEVLGFEPTKKATPDAIILSACDAADGVECEMTRAIVQKLGCPVWALTCKINMEVARELDLALWNIVKANAHLDIEGVMRIARRSDPRFHLYVQLTGVQ